jgi:hypothetical protein
MCKNNVPKLFWILKPQILNVETNHWNDFYLFISRQRTILG